MYFTATQSYFIEVAIGVYPLVLLVVMYAFVTLRDCGCRVIVKIWKPFHFCISRFQSKLNIKTSLIDTFATFLLLSYMKIGFTGLYVLTPTALYSPDGSYRLVLYVDPSVEYFGPSHIGYICCHYSAPCICSVDHSHHLPVPLPISMVSEMSQSR